MSLVTNSQGNLIEFNHPYFQTLIYQLAELLAFGIYFLQVKVLKITDESEEDYSISTKKSDYFDKILQERKTFIGSMVSSFVGSPGK